MEDDKQNAPTQLGSQRTLTVSMLYRQWGTHRKSECVVPSVRLNGKWLAALGFVPGSEDLCHRKRLNHHDRTPMNAEKIRLKLLNWWNELLFLWLIMVGTRLFGCVAISHGEDGNPRAIHFAINQREFNISIRNFVERLDR